MTGEAAAGSAFCVRPIFDKSIFVGSEALFESKIDEFTSMLGMMLQTPCLSSHQLPGTQS